jgi:hypothetical protein
VDKKARFICSIRELGVRGMQISDATAAFLFDAGKSHPHLKLLDGQNTIAAQQNCLIASKMIPASIVLRGHLPNK